MKLSKGNIVNVRLSLFFGVFLVVLVGIYIYRTKVSADIVTQRTQDATRDDFAPGELLVKFKPSASQDTAKALAELGISGLTAEPLLRNDAITSIRGTKALEILPQSYVKLTIAKSDADQMLDRASKASNTSSGFQDKLLERKKLETLSALEKLRDNPNVEIASLNYKRKANWEPDDPYYTQTSPSDQMWNLRSLSMGSAWELSRGENVVVAVIDSGVDYNHPDLSSSIYKTNDSSASIIGSNFTSNDPTDFMDRNGHGTHVAGIIAAQGGNSIGIIGVAPQSKIMPIKGLDDDGAGYDSNLINGIYYAQSHGAKILNMSWGGVGNDPIIDEALQVVKNMGVVSIVAAGNESADANNFFPANSSSVITVGASDSSGKLASFSNFGPKIDVVAPGKNILSTIPEIAAIKEESSVAVVDEIYARVSGTSMAAPHVAGLAALLISKNPTWTNDIVKNVINQNAKDAGARGPDDTFGFGIIQPIVSLSVVSPLTPPTASLNDLPITTTNGQFAITGSASGNNFQSYEIGYRKIDRNATITGTNDSNNAYIKLTDVSTPVENGNLFNVNLPRNSLSDGFYYFRLLVKSADGSKSKISKYIFVNRNEITGFPWQASNSITRADMQPEVAKLDGQNSSLVVATYGKVMAYDKSANIRWSHTFGSEEVEEFGIATTITSKPLIVDLNNDGKLEIVVITYNKLYVLNYNGRELWHVRTNSFSYSVLCYAGDFNNDGTKEILLGSQKDDSYDLTLLRPDGTVLTEKAVNFNNTKGVIDLGASFAGDIDGNGKTEFTISFSDSYTTPVLGGNRLSIDYRLALISSSLETVWMKDMALGDGVASLAIVQDAKVSRLPLIMMLTYSCTDPMKTIWKVALLNKNGKTIKTVFKKTLFDDASLENLFQIRESQSDSASYVFTERLAYPESNNLVHNLNYLGQELTGWPSRQSLTTWATSSADADNDNKMEVLGVDYNTGPVVLKDGRTVRINGGRSAGAGIFSGCALGDIDGNEKLECYMQASDVSTIFQSFWPSLPGIYGWQL